MEQLEPIFMQSKKRDLNSKENWKFYSSGEKIRVGDSFLKTPK